MPKAVYKVTTILPAAWYKFFEIAALGKSCKSGCLHGGGISIPPRQHAQHLEYL